MSAARLLMTQSGNKHERCALVWLLLLDLGFALLLSSSRCSTGMLSRWPLGPLGILAAPVFEQALDNSQQLCLGWGFTLGKETVDIEVRSPIV